MVVQNIMKLPGRGSILIYDCLLVSFLFFNSLSQPALLSIITYRIATHWQ